MCSPVQVNGIKVASPSNPSNPSNPFNLILKVRPAPGANTNEGCCSPGLHKSDTGDTSHGAPSSTAVPTPTLFSSVFGFFDFAVDLPLYLLDHVERSWVSSPLELIPVCVLSAVEALEQLDESVSR